MLPTLSNKTTPAVLTWAHMPHLDVQLLLEIPGKTLHHFQSIELNYSLYFKEKKNLSQTFHLNNL